MAADNDQVSIVNMALCHIKQPTITAMTDASEPARKAGLFWLKALRATLRACDWNFAGQDQELALLGDVVTATDNPTVQADQDIIGGWVYTYAYPAACARVRCVFNPQYGDFPEIHDPFLDRTLSEVRIKKAEFLVQRSPITNQLAIATNLESAWVRFTQLITDTSQWDDMAVEALSYVLASKMAMPLSCSLEVKQSVDADLEKIMGEAKRKNGGEGTEKGPTTSSYEDVRT